MLFHSHQTMWDYSQHKRVMGKKEVNTAAAAAEQKKAWLPNPVTGYYRPAGSPREVDAAELRAKLLTG